MQTNKRQPWVQETKHALYLPKGYSRSPYKYNKIIKNSTFLLSLDSIDLSGAHTHKIWVLPFLTAPSPLTGLGINLSSQFMLPVVTQTVGCSGSVPGSGGHVPAGEHSDTEMLMVLRQVKHERDRKSLDQVRGHAACKPAEPHLQLETIFKEGSSLIKNPTLHVKWREGLLSCFFYSLCLKKKKKKLYFSVESSRTWFGAIQRSATHGGESDLLPTSPRAWAIPNKARGSSSPRSRQDQPGMGTARCPPSLCSVRDIWARRRSPVWNEKKGRPTPSTLWHRLAAGGSEGGLCRLPGSWPSFRSVGWED